MIIFKLIVSNKVKLYDAQDNKSEDLKMKEKTFQMKVTEDENGKLSCESVNDGFSLEMITYILSDKLHGCLAGKPGAEKKDIVYTPGEECDNFYGCDNEYGKEDINE